MSWRTAALCLLAAVVLFSRLAHIDLVWIEEAYGLAAGAEILRGKLLYSEIWFDKPPLYALFYAALGASSRWILRLAGAAVVLLSCTLAFLLGRRFWGVNEGVLAAVLLGAGLIFWIPSAVMAIAPDLLMLVPHLAAVYLASRRKAFAAGVVAGIGLLCNSKGLVLLPVCLLWVWREAVPFFLGWIVPQVACAMVFPIDAYWRQVWVWGAMYSADSFVENPFTEGLRRTVNWMGFQAAAVAGTIVWLWRERDWRMIAWLALSCIAVIGGLRFFPRYYFQLLPVVSVLGARGLLLIGPRWRVAALALLLIPVVRFGPTYVRAASGEIAGWSDLAMMEDSRSVAVWLRAHAGGEAGLLVWGYRPDIYVFSGLHAGTRFLDSQPLTGVLADRHLTQSEPSAAGLAAANRSELVRTSPVFIVDGLGPLNPKLAISEYADLAKWLADYEVVHRTPMSVVYRRREKIT